MLDNVNSNVAFNTAEISQDAEAEDHIWPPAWKTLAGLTEIGFAVPLLCDVPDAFASLGAFIPLCGITSPLAVEILIHVDYLAAKAGATSATILAGEAFRVAPRILSDALKNIGAVLAETQQRAALVVEAEAIKAASAGETVAAADDFRCQFDGPYVTVGTFRRIYHYHLKKCGGSTLNQWLDTLTADRRAMNPKWTGSWLLGDREAERVITRHSFDAAKAKSIFHWSDVVHSHAALRAYAPPDTFCMTMLRDPVERLVSQVSDWRRLGPVDTASDPAFVQACVADSQSMTLCGFLKQYAYGAGRMLFDNYMTRALAATRIGRLVLEVDNADRLLDIARQSLENDYGFVGLTEELDLSRNAICCLLGLPPARPGSVLNESRAASASDQEANHASTLLDDLTRTDQELYRRACQLFNRHHRRIAETYDAKAFETHHATRQLSQLRGMEDEDSTRYSVRDPIIGSGFHGRDSAGQTFCAIWTGPGSKSTLYIPVPSDLPLSLLIWIRGYATLWQRERLRLKIDGHPAKHRFRPADGYADVLIIEASTTRDFVRLEFNTGGTACCLEPQGYDPRQRGIAINSYGWRRT